MAFLGCFYITSFPSFVIYRGLATLVGNRSPKFACIKSSCSMLGPAILSIASQRSFMCVIACFLSRKTCLYKRLYCWDKTYTVVPAGTTCLLRPLVPGMNPSCGSVTRLHSNLFMDILGSFRWCLVTNGCRVRSFVTVTCYFVCYLLSLPIRGQVLTTCEHVRCRSTSVVFQPERKVRY